MINKIKQIFNWASLKKGVIKGYSIPLLPDNINKFYNLPLIRILRVIGGFCAVLILTKSYLHFPEIIRWIVLIFGIIQLLQIVIISIIKVIYGIKKLKNNSNNFEVTNIITNKTEEYETLTWVALALGVNKTTVKKAMDSGRILKKIYIIKSKNKK